MSDTLITQLPLLPDESSAFVTASPLPSDHWLYKANDNPPPMLMQCGTAHPDRKALETAIRAGVRYAMKASTDHGRDNDIDPDALVNNCIIGILGYFTPDGTQATSDCTYNAGEQGDTHGSQ
jgi:hypothetical protein